MEHIKNIIFDFGNVLMDLDLGATERQFQVFWGKDFEQTRARLQQSRIFELYEMGGLSTEEFVEAIRFAGPAPLSEKQVTDAWNAILLGMPAHRFDFLLQLRQRYQVFLLSNINELHEHWVADYMMREHQIPDYEMRYFDGVYFSHLIRLRKPDLNIYEYVLADAEISGAETLFFDDLKVNVEAAQQVGIQGIFHAVGREIEEHVSTVLGVANNK